MATRPDHEDPQTLPDARLPGAADPDHDDHDLAHDIHGGPGVGDSGHVGHDAVGHDDHDHDEHPVEDPRWVLLPLAVGLVIGVVVLVLLGLGSGVS